MADILLRRFRAGKCVKLKKCNLKLAFQIIYFFENRTIFGGVMSSSKITFSAIIYSMRFFGWSCRFRDIIAKKNVKNNMGLNSTYLVLFPRKLLFLILNGVKRVAFVE
uniref:Uncharacterized protein n=1 Tax=Cacopsylla melanoneura TaxID=428564 RepID=A0A8D8QYE4_9HEMI